MREWKRKEERVGEKIELWEKEGKREMMNGMHRKTEEFRERERERERERDRDQKEERARTDKRAIERTEMG